MRLKLDDGRIYWSDDGGRTVWRMWHPGDVPQRVTDQAELDWVRLKTAAYGVPQDAEQKPAERSTPSGNAYLRAKKGV